MSRLFTSFLLLFLVVFAVTAQTRAKISPPKRVEQELLQVNKTYDEALVRSDIAALERIFAEEFIYISTSGSVANRAQQIELIRSGALKIDSGASDDVHVRLYGETALVFGHFKAKGQFNGQAFDSIERYTSVWIKRSGRWQLVAEQGTLVSSP